MKPSDSSSDDLTAQFKKAVNRISVPLKQLEASDTTLRHAQIQYSLKSNGHQLQLLKRINQALYVLIGCVAAYFLLYVLYLGPREGKIREIKTIAVQEEVAVPIVGYAEWGNLQQAIGRRSIFEPVAALAQAEKTAFEQEILQRIKVVGVMLDESPKAIIQVITSGETVFASKGDSVSGAVVQDILENKVILKYNGLELELLR